MITALVSKKGGVGKTTTAVHLAAALALGGRRVLLADLDSQASASLALGVPRERLGPSSADVLLAGMAVAEAVRPTSTPGLELLTGSVDLASAEAELGAFRDPTARLAQVLEPVRGGYDFIVLDCPPSLSLLPANALAACDAFLLPVVPHYLALAGVASTLSFAERLRWRGGEGARLLGIVLTMVDARLRAVRDNARRLRREYGEKVFDREVRFNARLMEAPAQGQTVFQLDPEASGATAYRRLAEEFLVRAESLPRGKAGPPA